MSRPAGVRAGPLPVTTSSSRAMVTIVLAAAIFQLLISSFEPGGGIVSAAALPGAWESVGPGPAVDGQTEHVSRVPGSGIYENDVIGAVNRILPHPTNANIMYIATVGGGIWKTTNAQATPPSWTPLTDYVTRSLSMTALVLDYNNPDTILAGFGATSSFYSLGGEQLGILRSRDAGNTWDRLTHPLLTNVRIAQLFIHGNTILACTIGNDRGIVRSTDGGISWTNELSAVKNLRSCYDFAFSLPASSGSSLRLGIALMDEGSGQSWPGLYRTLDGGASWVFRVSLSSAISYDVIRGGKVRIHPRTSRVVASYVLESDVLNANIVFSSDEGTTWSSMVQPQTAENGGSTGTNPVYMAGISVEPEEDDKAKSDLSTAGSLGKVPGGQADLHFSMSLHPADDNFVFVGGDRQTLDPDFNSIGATDYSGRLFVCIISWNQCFPFTHGLGSAPGSERLGTTASFSSPHADSRDMQADAAGNIIEADDGGIYRRTNPLKVVRSQGGLGDWYSMIGNLRCTEIHDVAYDVNHDVFFIGNQDTGTQRQRQAGAPETVTVSKGDGGDVVCGRISATVTVLYSSYPSFGGPAWRHFDNNGEIEYGDIMLRPYESRVGEGEFFPFKTSMGINRFDATRILVHGNNAVYESVDKGQTASIISECSGESGVDGIMYGGRMGGVNYRDLVYVLCDSPPGIFVRSRTNSRLLGMPNFGKLASLAVDRDNADLVFVVYHETTTLMLQGLMAGGGSYTDITGDLSTKTSYLQTVEFVRGASGQGFVLVGGRGGVFVTGPMSNSADFGVKWWDMEPLASAVLPNVFVHELDYVPEKDLLVAGTLGRGVHYLRQASRAVDSPVVNCPTPPVSLATGTLVDLAALFADNYIQQGVGDVSCIVVGGSGFVPGLLDVKCTVQNTLYGAKECSFQLQFGGLSCSNAISFVYDGQATDLKGSNVGASTAALPACGMEASLQASTIWYKFSVTSPVALLFKVTSATGLDTVIRLYSNPTESCSALSCVGANDDESNSIRASRLEASLLPSTTYYIAVHGYNNATGPFTLNISGTCRNAISFTYGGQPVTLRGNNAAEYSTLLPPCLDWPSKQVRTLWYKFNVTVAATLVFDLTSSTFDTFMQLFSSQGDSCSLLSCVSFNDDVAAGVSTNSRIEAAVLPSTVYYIAVQGYDGAAGNFTLTVNASTTQAGGNLNAPSLTFSERGLGGVPAAPAMAVGPSHVITIVKSSFGRSLYRVYVKEPWQQVKQSFLTQFHRSNTICRVGPFVGAPNVLYDHLADRWVIMELARDSTTGGSYLCLLLSLSNIPYGLLYRGFTIALPVDPGEISIAVMPEAYYLGTSENPPAVYALDRARYIAAGTIRPLVRLQVSALSGLPLQGLMPGHLLGNPRAGSSCGLFARPVDDELETQSPVGTADFMEVWEFCPNWDTATPQVNRLANIRITDFNTAICGSNDNVPCFAQPGSTTLLLPNRNSVMPSRLQYRSFSDREALLATFTVGGGNGKGAVLWVELRRAISAAGALGAWERVQDGVTPSDDKNRWHGCAAMDRSGNIALGYSGVDATNGIYPSLYYTGRGATAPSGVMSSPETMLVNGTSASTTSTFGGRSTVVVDPMDGCKFYFLGPWETRTSRSATYLGAVSFSQCTDSAECLVNSSCNDGQFCTRDVCRDGKCVAEPDPLLCPFGQVCDEVADICRTA